MANPNGLDEILTFVTENRTKALADNVSDNVALLSFLKKKGNTKPADGGSVIMQELSYAENGTFGWYSGLALAA